MANMLNTAKQAIDRALQVLQETEPYVTGVNEDGKKLMYVLLETLKSSLDELNRAIGEIDNILPTYKETPNKEEMKDLARRLQERIDALKQRLH